MAFSGSGPVRFSVLYRLAQVMVSKGMMAGPMLACVNINFAGFVVNFRVTIAGNSSAPRVGSSAIRSPRVRRLPADLHAHLSDGATEAVPPVISFQAGPEGFGRNLLFLARQQSG